MPSSIDNAMIASPDEYTLTDEYKAYVESIIPLLNSHPSSERITVTPETGWLYRGNLTAFLLDQKVALEDHLVIYRMNDLNGPQDFDENSTVLVVPDRQYLSKLKSVYKTRL